MKIIKLTKPPIGRTELQISKVDPRQPVHSPLPASVVTSTSSPTCPRCRRYLPTDEAKTKGFPLCLCEAMREAAARRQALMPTAAAAELLEMTVGRFTRLMAKLGIEHDDEYTNPHRRSGPKGKLWSRQRMHEVKASLENNDADADTPTIH